ncbi:hypothetical protein C9374_011594 [Naegleria lovaniensis]|uniref:Uncharacterized protein n=1 Tax=Naegleria lovaniensis TaxID=51637 RepID=A0AA88GEI8_NAELO|nr:uncharacterized protein C9374_011594 [Naegleria lovaniensis]KAG2373929.1 hypothetical protein C9374_011594 [Naegleria lovaniensis]
MRSQQFLFSHSSLLINVVVVTTTLLLLFTSFISATRICYINQPGGGSGGITPYTFTESGIVCVRYGYKCKQNDSSCSASEIAQGTIKKTYTGVSQATCDSMKSAPTVYLDTYCCNTELCNGDSTNNGGMSLNVMGIQWMMNRIMIVLCMVVVCMMVL